MSRIMRSVFSPSSLRDGLVPAVNIWRRLRQRIFDSYHPELHYMRALARNGVRSTPTLFRSCRSRVTDRLVDQLASPTARFRTLMVAA